MTGRIVALVPARNEQGWIGETVRALQGIVEEVMVVDDGSRDGTGAEALAQGATVLRIPGHAGKGGAIEGALRRIEPADVWVLADADLGSSASGLRGLIQEVLDGRADLAIASFPPLGGGGFGIVKRLAREAIRLLSGFDAREPLSGQRAVSARCLAAVRPLAPGFGLETAMTIDAVRAGFRVVEMPVEGLVHRPMGRGLRGFAHRGRQGVEILRASLVRTVRLR